MWPLQSQAAETYSLQKKSTSTPSLNSLYLLTTHFQSQLYPGCHIPYRFNASLPSLFIFFVSYISLVTWFLGQCWCKRDESGFLFLTTSQTSLQPLHMVVNYFFPFTFALLTEFYICNHTGTKQYKGTLLQIRHSLTMPIYYGSYIIAISFSLSYHSVVNFIVYDFSPK